MTVHSSTDRAEESIGTRIKALRQNQNLTLAEVALKADLSASHLSQIERSKVTPSLMTVASIATALNVSMRDLFEENDEKVYITRIPLDRGRENGKEAAGSLRLTQADSKRDLEVYQMVLHPGTSPLEFEPYAGEVLGFVLEGTLDLYAEDEQFILHAGDSIHYDANRRYCLRCGGHESCTILWCNSPPRKFTPEVCTTG